MLIQQKDDAMSRVKKRGPFPPAWCRFKTVRGLEEDVFDQQGKSSQLQDEWRDYEELYEIAGTKEGNMLVAVPVA